MTARMLRSIALIIIYFGSIVMTVRIVWVIIFDRQEGAVVLTLTQTHGIHTGDILALIVGVGVVCLLILGVVVEIAKLQRIRTEADPRN